MYVGSAAAPIYRLDREYLEGKGDLVKWANIGDNWGYYVGFIGVTSLLAKSP